MMIMRKARLLILMIVVSLVSCQQFNEANVSDRNVDVTIFPDYTDVYIPNNIAPMNFKIMDSIEGYYVSIKHESGLELEMKGSGDVVQYSMSDWHTMLNTPGAYTIQIYGSKEGKWVAYKSFENHITDEAVDNFLVYRFINPANILWNKMGIFQRNLSNYDVKPIMTNDLTNQNCMHCHSFAANNADNFMLHMRGNPGGTVIYSNGEAKFVDTKTEYTMSPGGYPSWHPSGDYIAFSTNKIHQRFHSEKDKYAFVFDEKSDIILYDVRKNEVQAIENLNKEEFENMPTWSPDGKYLYFLSSESYDSDTMTYDEVMYDLKRIAFDAESKSWGEIEDLIIARDIGKSVAFPRVSVDNRYVVMCLADYGYFTVYNETSDIAILDLESMEIITPGINSDGVESYPSWSFNGKWIMFNSKRADGLSSRPYFAYFENGVAKKPFILPQKDPNWNIEELFNINRPELVNSELKLNPQKILKLVKNQPIKTKFDLNTLKYLEGSNHGEDKNTLYESAE